MFSTGRTARPTRKSKTSSRWMAAIALFGTAGLGIGAGLFGSPPAGAEPVLLEVTPASGATIPSEATRFTFRFIDPIASFGTRLSGSVGIIGTDRAVRGATDREAIFDIPALPSGAYTLTWSAEGLDKSTTTGQQRFSVVPLTVDAPTTVLPTITSIPIPPSSIESRSPTEDATTTSISTSTISATPISPSTITSSTETVTPLREASIPTATPAPTTPAPTTTRPKRPLTTTTTITPATSTTVLATTVLSEPVVLTTVARPSTTTPRTSAAPGTPGTTGTPASSTPTGLPAPSVDRSRTETTTAKLGVNTLPPDQGGAVVPAKPLEVPLKTVPTTTTIAGTSTTAPQPVTAASPTSETAVAETVTPTGSRSGGIAKFLHRLVLGAALMALLAALIGLVLRRTPWGLRRLLMGIAALSIAAVALLSLFGILDSAVSHGNRLLPLRIVAAISLLGAAVIRLVVADRTLDRYDLMMYTRTKGATDRVGFASVERVMQRFPAVLGGHILFATLLVVGAALLMVR